MNVSGKMFERIKSKRVFEEVSTKIKSLIFEGVLNPGDKLPAESQLAEQFGVGRQTIREALRVLELSGFINVQQGFGGGPVVVNDISGKITGLFLDAFQMENISADDFTKARMTFEKAILVEAIDNAEQADIDNLQENVDQAKELINAGKVATDLNLIFHSFLAKASKNKVFMVLEQTINAIHKHLRARKAPDINLSQSVVKAHEDILKAIKEKDHEKALSILETHITKVADSY